MVHKTLLVGLILTVSFIHYTQGYKACIVPPKADTDEAWFIKAAAAGFTVAEHSDCDNCEKEEAWAWLRAQGRTIPKKMCWMHHVTTKYGSYVLPFNCKYYDVAKQECEMDFSHSDIKGKMQWGGQFIFAKTDNKTYVAGTTCIFGKENFWWIISTDPTGVLANGVLEELRAHFVKLGFQTGNIAVEGKSPLYVKKLSAHPENC